MKPYAAIDLGSNTLRLLIAKPSATSQTWIQLDYAHHITRLGAGLHHTGKLSDEAMQRAVAGLQDFAKRLRVHGLLPQDVFVVATAAVREAVNRQVFLDLCKQETGFDLQVIEGDVEATLSTKGAVSVLHTETAKDMLLFDIGGGSTEFIVHRRQAIEHRCSCRLGVVRLIDAYMQQDPPNLVDYQAMQAETLRHLQHIDFLEDNAPSHLVGTAGTITTMAAIALDMHVYDADKINNYRMDRQQIATLAESLCALTYAQRAAIPAIESGRADLMIAGLAICETVMDFYAYDALICVDAGLLEGAWMKSASLNA